MDNLYFVFTGAPGCGKGTQARILKDKTGIAHLSTGEMLRAETATGSILGSQIKELLDKGQFATDEMIIEMVSNRIEQEDCKKGFILDGFPRTLAQVDALKAMLDAKGIKLNAAIQIQVPDEIIMERILGRYACMKCGQGYHDKFLKPKIYGVCDVCGDTNFYRRVDDNRETVQARLVNYREKTYPTIPAFEKAGLLKTVDGTGTIEATANKIWNIISN
ncbi:MAG: adenylate kinase [Alphaproteobacteria bacterium]